jgi:hypothetical protein
MRTWQKRRKPLSGPCNCDDCTKRLQWKGIDWFIKNNGSALLFVHSHVGSGKQVLQGNKKETHCFADVILRGLMEISAFKGL